MLNINEITKRAVIDTEDVLPDFLQAKENCILYDYFTGTSKVDDVQDILNLIGMQESDFEQMYGLRAYKSRLYRDGISIMYDGFTPDMGVCLDMSGQGCRVFETFGNGDWKKLHAHFKQDTLFNDKDCYKITRFDVAYDDFVGVIPLDKIIELVEKNLLLARASNRHVEKSFKDDKLCGLCVYIGSKKSNVLIRFYDKALERGYEGVHWVRCEIQMRDVNAKNFIMCDKPIGEKMACVLNNYVRFVVENPEDSNKARWETEQFWLDFVQTVEKISIFSKKNVEYNLSRCERYVFLQAGASIKTLIECYGVDEFVKQLNCRASPLKDKHSTVISTFKTEREKREKEQAKAEAESKLKREQAEA